jgi:hypothetical protein
MGLLDPVPRNCCRPCNPSAASQFTSFYNSDGPGANNPDSRSDNKVRPARAAAIDTPLFLDECHSILPCHL